MASLNPLYILAFTFEQYFVDKDTALPMANGYINFYEDEARSVPKDVYILAGTPGSYTYTNIGSTVSLSGFGVPMYLNNNVAIYFYPYDSNGDVELYYYEVYNSDNTLQFTREGQPNVFPSDTTESVNNNYVPNGQFLVHTDVPATMANTYVAGQITNPITVIAPGGWTYERPNSSTATDLVIFNEIPSITSTTPPFGPRYNVEIICQNPGGGDAIKDLRVKFAGVNKFSNGNPYSYVFYANSNTGSNISVQIIIGSNYGTGGSPYAEQTITTISVPAAGQLFSIPITFGTNTGKTIGTNNDDYLQLICRMPSSALFDITFTDFGLFSGTITNPVFAVETNRQFLYKSLFGDYNIYQPTTTNLTTFTPNLPLNEVPIPDGSSYYLPMVMTPNGIAFDRSSIGDVVFESSNNIANYYTNSISILSNRLLPNGNQYETAGYSPLGIPYSRLQAVYWNPTLQLPIWGTGPQYFTNSIPAGANAMLVSNNTKGAFTAASDGSTATGFTFINVSVGSAVYYTKAYITATGGYFNLQNLELGAVTAPTAHTSGFTITNVQIGTSLLPEIDNIQTVDATSLANPSGAGKYFEFHSIHATVAQPFYVWYQITNETDPAPAGYTGIKIILDAADTATIVAQKTQQALNGWQQTEIQTVAATTPIPAGAYFNIYSSTQHYVVWYYINGAGTKPSVSGAVYIQVTLTGSETANQVATLTQAAMNFKYFAVPDFRGYFLRNLDLSAGVDLDVATRWSLVPGIIGDVMGTYQLSQNLSHYHLWGNPDVTGGNTGASDVTDSPNGVPTSYEGGTEARPQNADVNFAILY